MISHDRQKELELNHYKPYRFTNNEVRYINHLAFTVCEGYCTEVRSKYGPISVINYDLISETKDGRTGIELLKLNSS